MRQSAVAESITTAEAQCRLDALLGSSPRPTTLQQLRALVELWREPIASVVWSVCLDAINDGSLACAVSDRYRLGPWRPRDDWARSADPASLLPPLGQRLDALAVADPFADRMRAVRAHLDARGVAASIVSATEHRITCASHHDGTPLVFVVDADGSVASVPGA